MQFIIKGFNGDLLVTIDEQVLELKELSRNERFSKEFDEVVEIKEKKKTYSSYESSLEACIFVFCLKHTYLQFHIYLYNHIWFLIENIFL